MTPQRRRREIGVCKCCGEAYVDIGTDAQRSAWMANHGADCKYPPERIDLAVQEYMLNILLSMPDGVVAQ